MRLVEIALLVISIQIGMGLVTISGLFPNIPYEKSVTEIQAPANPESTNAWEQMLAAISSFNKIVNSLTWGWIAEFFKPWYYYDIGLRNFVDNLITFLRVITAIIIMAAGIEFIRNRTGIL